MTQFKTVQIAFFGALGGAAIGTLALYLDPGRNDIRIAWIWIAMAATCAMLGAAGAGGLSGAWNFVARRNAG